ncbi:MAG: IS66 family transposase [Saprospiraceae bacterium]|nr:IS66 family transposase [Saprospiraceae bacterium]
MLSHLIVSKFIDHLPFYRQIQIFKREFDWNVSASTINDWFVACCTLIEPLYEELKRQVLSSGYLQVDESPIKVLDSDKPGSTHQGYQWVYHSPERRLVLFDYRKGRGMHGPKEVLENYNGWLQCDGYGVYDKIATLEGIQIAGCLAHARRYYHERH